MIRGALKIARLEAARYVRIINRQVLLTALAAGLLIGILAPSIAERGFQTDAGLYLVEITSDSPLRPVVDSDRRFTVLEGVRGRFMEGRADLLIVGASVLFDPDSAKSSAAARELEVAALMWLDARLEDESDRDAAFPVRVNLVYQPRVLAGPAPPPPSPGPSPSPGPETPPGPSPTPSDPEILAQITTATETQLDLTPSQVDPPFPIRALILTFAYLIPLNFVAQLYSGALLTDRVRQRGVLLLSTPYRGAEILLGKSLPYAAAALVAAILATIFIGSNLLGLLAALPILLFGLATALIVGLLARSPRELTFLIVTTSVLLSTFLFLPAIFIEIHPVAYLSPISVVVDTIRGDPTSVGTFLYATVPLTLAGVVLAMLSVALYKEEHLFAPKTVLTKLLDAVHGLTRSRRALFGAGVLAVPFAVGLELFVLIFAVTLDLGTAFAVFLVGGALVEEALKALPIYANRSRALGRPMAGWVLGGLVGLGFFVGEKVALVFSLVGFGLLPQGEAALATFGVADSLVLLGAPLLLHSGTATLLAAATRRGRLGTLLGWFAASAVHAAYNLLIVTGILGVGP